MPWWKIIISLLDYILKFSTASGDVRRWQCQEMQVQWQYNAIQYNIYRALVKDITKEQRGSILGSNNAINVVQQLPKLDKNTARRFQWKAFV